MKTRFLLFTRGKYRERFLGLVSVAPLGLCLSHNATQAGAVGCILAPLRGWLRFLRSRQSELNPGRGSQFWPETCELRPETSNLKSEIKHWKSGNWKSGNLEIGNLEIWKLELWIEIGKGTEPQELRVPRWC